MRIAKNDVPTKIDVPGAKARQITEFGDATAYGKISGEYFSLSAGTDISPLLQGLEGEVKVGQDAEVILFSPQHEHSEVIEHMLSKMKA